MHGVQKPRVSTPPRQTNLLTDHLKAVNAQSVNMIFAEAFAMNALSHTLLSRESFIQMLHIFRQSASAVPPTPAELRTSIIKRGSELKQQMIHKIRNAGFPATLAIDGWTNTRHEKVTNIVILSCDSAYYYASMTNTNATNDAEWLADNITPHIQSVIDSGIKIVALAADNENLNGALHRRLLVTFPFLLLIPCAAHTIQLAVRHTMKLKRFSELVSVVMSIVHRFSSSKDERLRLIK